MAEKRQFQRTGVITELSYDDVVRVLAPNAGTEAMADGYYLLDAPDPEAAVALAQRIPVIRWGATVEIRPVVER